MHQVLEGLSAVCPSAADRSIQELDYCFLTRDMIQVHEPFMQLSQFRPGYGRLWRTERPEKL